MTVKHIAVIDYGMGNLHSVASALHHVGGVNVDVTNDPEVIHRADHVIFPGVGAIRDCMAEIRRLKVDQTLSANIDSGKPILAICVGMQALLDRSEENDGVDCLGHFGGEVESFANNSAFIKQNSENSMKVPHMGWNQVQQTMAHPLWHGIDDDARFYFVHSYFVNVQDPMYAAGRSEYGIPFCSAIAHNNIFAVQFHPEKSHTNGLQLLKNFLQWDGNR